MSSDSAKYARLARKAKRLSKFRSTCMARYVKEKIKEREAHEVGDDPWTNVYHERMRQINKEYNTLGDMIRNIKVEMARLAGREVMHDASVRGPPRW